ncbi:intradiol ring-cleavage dioxygenase [Croceibacterium sp. LX-88]|uniref:Intradiol ring-cleavage dioxygenase n=1 Tax=Croceibacterium selenioxidans TaxID=2838833 RepID=A0ABS5W0Y3_9SPHN|nr:intradiol ring-cleavage dioxygenase [Croceibacterium selenioxidans]MBT2133126.1 intradiol ring-cleavage dioxygenase [Croceibacterium selenioxidans]
MSQLSRDLAAGMDRRRVLGGIALGLGGVLAGCGSRAGAQDGATACMATPTETKGPFPADGSNGSQRPINVLDLDGVIRRDIRSGFAGMSGTAEGVPFELEIEIVGATCGVLPGHAIYLWQNDAKGAYSLYTHAETNYLRGLQPADAKGRVRFTSIVPGCYGGRYPHCHFEVFESAEAAVGGARPLLVSQLAFPQAECRAIYLNDARYGDSLSNLERLPIGRDFVFGDADAAGQARQTVVLTGDLAHGYRGVAKVALG